MGEKSQKNRENRRPKLWSKEMVEVCSYSKFISEQLGHANVKTTDNIYVHFLEDAKVKEIEKLAEIEKLLK